MDLIFQLFLSIADGKVLVRLNYLFTSKFLIIQIVADQEAHIYSLLFTQYTINPYLR